jgi:LysM repeat protein
MSHPFRTLQERMMNKQTINRAFSVASRAALVLAVVGIVAQAQETKSKAMPVAPFSTVDEHPAKASAKNGGRKDYIVKEGDSLSRIAKDQKVPLGDIIRWNAPQSGLPLRPGTILKLDGPPAPVRKRVVHKKVEPQKVEAKKDEAKKDEKVEDKKAEEKKAEEKKDEKAPALYPIAVKALPPSEAERERSPRNLSLIKEVYYSPDVIPTMNCGLNTVFTIILPQWEKIVTAQSGNVDTWGWTPAFGSNLVYGKPTLPGPGQSTNLVLVTERGTFYNINLTVDVDKPTVQVLRILPSPNYNGSGMTIGTPGAIVDAGGDAVAGNGQAMAMNPGLMREVVERVREDERNKAKAEENAFAQAMFAGRNDNYKISYDWFTPFRIVNVFDAMGQTYIKFESPTGEQPMFYVEENGQRTIVQWTPSIHDKTVIMVDRVFKTGILVIGKKEARIYNKGLKKELAKLDKIAK